jgi:hypothetical protein
LTAGPLPKGLSDHPIAGGSGRRFMSPRWWSFLASGTECRCHRYYSKHGEQKQRSDRASHGTPPNTQQGVGTLPPKALTANVRRPLGGRLIGVGVEPLLPWPHYLDRTRDDLGVQAVGRWWRSDGSGLRMSVASLAPAAMDQAVADTSRGPLNSRRRFAASPLRTIVAYAPYRPPQELSRSMLK